VGVQPELVEPKEAPFNRHALQKNIIPLRGKSKINTLLAETYGKETTENADTLPTHRNLKNPKQNTKKIKN